MAWVRLDDGFAEHPKIAKVGAFGAWLQIQALCYSNRNLTDGFIPWSVARTLAGHGVEMTDGKDRVWHLAQTCGMTGRDLEEIDWPALLVEAGMWEAVAGGYRIHDYDHYQPSKAQVLRDRRLHLARQRQYLKRKRGVNAVDGVIDGVIDGDPVPEEEKIPSPTSQASRVNPRSGARARARAGTSPRTENTERQPIAIGQVLTEVMRR